MYKQTQSGPARVLQARDSDVTMDSQGFPALLKEVSDSERGSETKLDMGRSMSAFFDCDASAAACSPPPATKKEWRKKATEAGTDSATSPGKPVRKGMKKPAARIAKAKKAGPNRKAKLEQDTALHTATLSIGGGKHQTYIQHKPGGSGGKKKLVVGCATSMAQRTTKTHKAINEMLFDVAKKPGATKASVLAAREKLLEKHKII